MNDAPANELLPCPFCGSEAPLLQEQPAHEHFLSGMPPHHGSWTVECVACEVGMIEGEPGARARIIERWNRRAAMHPQEASEVDADSTWGFVAGIRHAMRDHGKRMQPEFLAYCRDIMQGRDNLARALREAVQVLADSDEEGLIEHSEQMERWRALLAAEDARDAP